MKIATTVFLISFASAAAAAAQNTAFDAAFGQIRQELRTAPPVSLQHLRDGPDLPTDAIVVARRTIGGAPDAFRNFVETVFGTVIAEDLVRAYGDNGPAPQIIDRSATSGFSVLPLEEFETGAVAYDWQRLNQKYPGIRYVVRMSEPVLDSVGTYAVVRYELLGSDRPHHASFVIFEKQPSGSWKRTIGRTGNLWK